MRFLLNTAIGLLLTSAIMLPGAANPPRHQTVVKDLAYGVSLYHLFQQDNIGAITELGVARSKNTLHNQPDDADLLLGSLYFDYGLPDQAAQIFTRLLDRDLSSETRQNVWFNLARVYYEQGRYERAADYLSRLTTPLTEALENQRHYMQSSLHLDSGEIDLAIQSAAGIAAEDTWSAYAEYNIGIAQITGQDAQNGLKRLTLLSAVETTDSEILALQDQARLVSGLYSLKQGNFDESLLQFGKIRLHSPVTTTALLATGTAWKRKQEPQKALSYWQLLINSKQPDRAALEASLAIADVYEELNQKALAAQAFDQAVKLYDGQLTELDKLIESIPHLQLFNTLSSANLLADITTGQHRKDPLLFNVLRSIQHTVSGNTFQQALLQYHELQQMAATIDTWKNSISAFQLMLGERRQSFEAKQPLVARVLDAAQLQNYEQQRDALATEVQRIQNEQDYLALADSDEADYLEQLDEIAQLLKRLQNNRDVSAQKEKYRLLQGLLYWDISTSFAPRYWKLQRQLQLLDRALEQAHASSASVLEASSHYYLRLDALNARIEQQNNEMKRLDNTLSTLILQQQEVINRLAQQALMQRKQQISQLRLSARTSLARLYDELSGQGKKP